MKLRGRVAVVAGATRGAGRGIAIELGREGAIVYCTGRSTSTQPSDLGRPETIEQTATMVQAAGGIGIPVRTDYSQPQQVQALMQQVWQQQGRLDVLVNDVWGGEKLVAWGQAFWQTPLEQHLRLFNQALHTHLIASHCALPYLVQQGHGLIVEVTDGDDDNYRGHFMYDLIKNTVIRMAKGLAAELKDYPGLSAVALTPGFLRSEEMLEHFGVDESNWRDAIAQDPYFAGSETPHFVGRAVAALAADPAIKQKSGQALSSWGLSNEYGFRDIDGSQPHWKRFFAQMQANQS